jgi:hypothetical protein
LPSDHPVLFTAITLVLFGLAMGFGMYYVLNPNAIAVALALGTAGGIAHEIVQSGGKVLVPKTVDGGDVNLGSLAGVVLGLVAGFLVLKGVDPSTLTKPSDMLNIAFEALTAGLALKGVTDIDVKKS